MSADLEMAPLGPPQDVAADPPIERAPAAHRRPGLVALLWSYRALVGLLVALPAAATLGAPTAQYPRAQGELFDAGGVMLLESVRLSRRAMPSIAWTGGAVTLLAAALGLVPLAVAIAGLGRRGRLPVSFLAGRAWAHAGTLALLYGLGLLAQVVAIALLSMLGFKIIELTKVAPPGEDIATAGVLAAALLFASMLGVIRDLAYVGAVHGGRRFYVATSRAVRCLLRRPIRVTFAWGWRTVLALAALAIAAWLTPMPRGTAVVVLGLVVHQAALAASAFARASWLAAAIRMLDEEV